MPFEDQLNANAVVEWRKKYLDFDRLKRAVVRCAKEQKKSTGSFMGDLEQRLLLNADPNGDEEPTSNELHDENLSLLIQDMMTEVDMVNSFYVEKEAEFEERFRSIKTFTTNFSVCPLFSLSLLQQQQQQQNNSIDVNFFFFFLTSKEKLWGTKLLDLSHGHDQPKGF